MLVLAALLSSCAPNAAWTPSDDWESRPAPTAWLMSGNQVAPGRTLVVGGVFREGQLYWLSADGSLERWRTPYDESGLYTWSHARTPDDLWVVTVGPTLLHWDGARWDRYAPTFATRPVLWGVYAPRADLGWAVGGDGTTNGQPLLLRWDGVSWQPETLPDVGATVSMYFKIWGASDHDVWIVGAAGSVFHYDGASWTGSTLATEGAAWFNVSGADGTVVVVGGLSHAWVGRWDGSTWLVRSLPDVPQLSGVWMHRADVAHVTGPNGFIGVLDVATLDIVRDDRVGPLPYHTVFGTDDGLVAVGGDLDTTAVPLTGALAIRRLGSDD
jgi:hypothetical protein